MLPGINISANSSITVGIRGFEEFSVRLRSFFLICLDAIYRVVGNFGIAIIAFTFIFYSIFFPIRWWQSKQFKKAQSNAPKMKEIQDKIKEFTKKGVPMDDPRMRQLQMDQLKMTKDSLPIAGCLPMILQIPLFVAFYTAITIGMDFRQTSFLWLPDLVFSRSVSHFGVSFCRFDGGFDGFNADHADSYQRAKSPAKNDDVSLCR